MLCLRSRPDRTAGVAAFLVCCGLSWPVSATAPPTVFPGERSLVGLGSERYASSPEAREAAIRVLYQRMVALTKHQTRPLALALSDFRVLAGTEMASSAVADVVSPVEGEVIDIERADGSDEGPDGPALHMARWIDAREAGTEALVTSWREGTLEELAGSLPWPVAAVVSYRVEASLDGRTKAYGALALWPQEDERSSGFAEQAVLIVEPGFRDFAGHVREGRPTVPPASVARSRAPGAPAATGHAIPAIPAAPLTILTFKRQLRTKLFIAPIDVVAGECDAYPVVGPPGGPMLLWLARYAAYMTTCIGSNKQYSENPLTGAESPIEARILAEVDLEWQCEAGRSTPRGGTATATGLIHGPGPLGLPGAGPPIDLKETLATNGRYAFVVSGHPNVFAEAMLQVHRPRIRTESWHRVAGRISCATDGLGRVTSSHRLAFSSATPFPSHRAYWYAYPPSGGGPVFASRPPIDLRQGPMSLLWRQPAVPPVGVP
jgi:hypothetical protein